MEIFIIAKGLVAVLVSFRKKLRLLILLLFLAWMLNFGRQAQSFLILLRGVIWRRTSGSFLAGDGHIQLFQILMNISGD